MFPDGLYGHPHFDDYRSGLDSYVIVRSGKQELVAGVAAELETVTDTDDPTNGPAKDGMSHAFFDNGGTCSKTDPDYNAALDFCDKGGRRVIAAYAQHTAYISKKTTLTSGIRFDHYNDFGESVNPRVGLVYADKGLFAKLIYGRAFRAPSYRELFARNNPVVNGNPDTKAETIDTVETTAGSQVGGVVATISGFYNFVNNLITPVGSDPGVVPIYQNSGTEQTFGAEGELRAKLSASQYFFLNYTRMAVNSENNSVTHPTPLVARELSNLGYRGTAANHVSYGAYVNYRGERLRDEFAADPRAKIPPTIFANAHITLYNLGIRGLELYATGRNLLNQAATAPSTYAPKVMGVLQSDIPLPRIEVYAGARIRL